MRKFCYTPIPNEEGIETIMKHRVTALLFVTMFVTGAGAQVKEGSDAEYLQKLSYSRLWYEWYRAREEGNRVLLNQCSDERRRRAAVLSDKDGRRPWNHEVLGPMGRRDSSTSTFDALDWIIGTKHYELIIRLRTFARDTHRQIASLHGTAALHARARGDMDQLKSALGEVDWHLGKAAYQASQLHMHIGAGRYQLPDSPSPENWIKAQSTLSRSRLHIESALDEVHAARLAQCRALASEEICKGLFEEDQLTRTLFLPPEYQ